MQPLVSVIIPVYNVERFLPACMESLLAQTLKDIELIFVSDASPDGSVGIIRSYAERYPETVFLIESAENHRQGGARNLGMRAARAPYIGFCDSDDMAHPELFAALYDEITASGSDAVFCQYVSVPEDAGLDGKPAASENLTPRLAWADALTRWHRVPLTDEGVMDLIAYPIGGIYCGLYKRDLLLQNDLFFPPDIRYEDNQWAALAKPYLKQVSFVNRILYYYRSNSASTINTRNADYQTDDRITSEQGLLRQAESRGFLQRYAPAYEYLYAYRYAVTTIRMMADLYDHPPIQKAETIARDMTSRFPSWEQNRYYLALTTEAQRAEYAQIIRDPAAWLQARRRAKQAAARKAAFYRAVGPAVAVAKKLLGLENTTLLK